jgi:hypothetical protein
MIMECLGSLVDGARESVVCSRPVRRCCWLAVPGRRRAHQPTTRLRRRMERAYTDWRHWVILGRMRGRNLKTTLPAFVSPICADGRSRFLNSAPTPVRARSSVDHPAPVLRASWTVHCGSPLASVFQDRAASASAIFSSKGHETTHNASRSHSTSPAGRAQSDRTACRHSNFHSRSPTSSCSHPAPGHRTGSATSDSPAPSSSCSRPISHHHLESLPR